MGSASATLTLLLLPFNPAETPARVPPVPTADTKPSTLPPVCSQIS